MAHAPCAAYQPQRLSRRHRIDVLSPDPAARCVDHTWEIEAPFIGTSYCYVRIEGADDELAWSSPVWISREWQV
jgi:hypothetical protein